MNIPLNRRQYDFTLERLASDCEEARHRFADFFEAPLERLGRLNQLCKKISLFQNGSTFQVWGSEFDR